MSQSHPTNRSLAPNEYELQRSQLPLFSQRVGLGCLRMLGWRVYFKPLPGPRGVVIVYPHTSNWDFFIGVLGRMSLGLPFRFIAKDSFFKGLAGLTIGRFMRWIGGEGVERQSSTGAIGRLAQRMVDAKWFWIVIAPEGTRSKKPYWRSGFYHLAKSANAPIACVYFDFKRRIISVVDYVYLTGNQHTDMEAIGIIFNGVHGMRPENASPIKLREHEEGSDERDGSSA